MQIFRSRFGQVITIAVSTILLGLLITIGLSEGFWEAATAAPGVLFVIALVISLYWIPRVEVDEGGVRIVNLIRTHYISWHAIQAIDTKYALTLIAAGKKYVAWGAPAPGRHSAIFASKDQGSHLPESTYLAGTVRPGDLINSESGAPAAYIRRIWQQRDIEGVESVNTTWHRKQILILILLLLALIVNL